MKIEVNNLKKTYGENLVFEHINFKVDDGGFCIVTGPSGCGKTTLLDILGFLEKYDEGQIYYDDMLVTKAKDKHRLLEHRISFLFQDFGLVENETVFDNFKLIKKFKKYHQDIIDNCLKKVGLDGILDKYVYELSGGEKQRVALAKVLYKGADLILADEPTASLDEGNKELVLKILEEFNHDLNTTIIMVTHDTSIKNRAGQIIEMKGGNKR